MNISARSPVEPRLMPLHKTPRGNNQRFVAQSLQDREGKQVHALIFRS